MEGGVSGTEAIVTWLVGAMETPVLSTPEEGVSEKISAFFFLFPDGLGAELLDTPKCALNSPKLESFKDNFLISAASGSLGEGSDDGCKVEISVPVLSLHSCTVFLFWSMVKWGLKLNSESKAALKPGYAESSIPGSSGTPIKVPGFRLIMGWATGGTSMVTFSVA